MTLAVAAGLGALLAACSDNGLHDRTVERAEQVAEQVVATAGSEAAAAVEAKVTQHGATLEAHAGSLQATLEAKGSTVKSTVETAVEEIDETLADLKAIAERLDHWVAGVLSALGALGDQATALKEDPGLIADGRWRSETRAALQALADRAEEASDLARELRESESLPRVSDALEELSDGLEDLVAQLEDVLSERDAQDFLSATEGLERLRTGLASLQRLTDSLR